MSEALGPGPHTRVRRLPEKARYDDETVWTIFDDAPFAHLAAVVDGLALAVPTLVAREGATLYVHGSRSNAAMNAVLQAGEASVSATIYEGLRLARSAFETSVAYRSAFAVGSTRDVDDLDERRRVLDITVEHVIPGRTSEVRPMSERELRLTRVVAIDVREASAKVSAGPTDDPDEDLALPIWSGTVSAHTVYGPIDADRRGAGAGVEIPDSVRRLLERRG